MKTTSISFWVIVVLYSFGMVGVGWYTYGATDPTKASRSIETIKLVFIMLGASGLFYRHT